MSSNNQRGFHVIEVILAVGVVLVIGFIGFRVWQAGQNKTANTSNTATVPAVTTAKDLDKVSSFVDELNTTSESDELKKLEQDLDSL